MAAMWDKCLLLISCFAIHLRSGFVDGQEFHSSIDPDAYLSTPQIIRRHGYEAESHIIQTDDGYLLTLHRIPTNRLGIRGKQPIFIQHGLLSSSTDWVDSGNNSLAFILANDGYDVWLGNVRGNTYSKGHVTLSPKDAKFWNFSWHDMALHDLPAMINHISNITNRPGEILYIGHSMGTTMFYALASERPQIAQSIRAMVALAPVVYMTHIKSPIRYLAPWINDIQFLVKHLGMNQFLPSSKILKFLSYDCEKKLKKEICEDVFFILCGFDKQQFNDTLLPVILSHVPAGTSTKTVIHYLQEIANEGKFQKFDYGKNGNMKEYGQSYPPLYKLNNVDVPMFLMYAENDWLASPIDVKRLAENLTNTNYEMYKIPLDTFNHVDFLWGIDAPRLVYGPMMDYLRTYPLYYVAE
ncbi:PREDICTED: lysosomal acid lipase/cholesteryl ester hydrolase-like [Nicrophorus vespilloides]|uniref:Lipase n=1 Tax=Nicrophorus vespilloides TaxID=110193 RepID=A0ABM1M7F3_NICVS|nr:PREDICTED: lysosomal acid lipase/cholesteryl ester hydrolase-like [Nicrophorus vespilloides]